MSQFDYVNTRREDVDAIPSQALVHQFIRLMTAANVFVFKATKGRLWKNFPGGYPICIVRTTGRKSRKPRRTSSLTSSSACALN